MKIEQFVAQSAGQWRAMRSAHSLAFKQFEQIVSTITIQTLEKNDPVVTKLRESYQHIKGNHVAPFLIEWATEEDWELESQDEITSGSTILIPIPQTNRSGFLVKSMGYAEPIQSLSNYNFLNDGTLKLTTKYKNSSAEERLWFLSENVRSRTSVIYSGKNLGIIQTSFSSEVRLKN